MTSRLSFANAVITRLIYRKARIYCRQTRAAQYHTEEEVEHSYEEFYEDVHTEFLKFGEIINFKVCRNGSFHLRGNVYVHYKSLDSAMMAYNSVNGRYFAGKQVTCEFVSLTRWKIAICGEYMKSRLKTCSRGSACNFLHCFSNPGGDYEWADCDKPPPRYWVKKMIALFGYSVDKQIEQLSPKDQQHSSRIFTSDSYHNKRHQHNGSSSRRHHDETHVRNSRRHERQNEKKSYKNDTDSDEDRLDKNSENRSRHHNRRDSKSNGRNTKTPQSSSSSDEDFYAEKTRQVHTKKKSYHKKVSGSSNVDEESDESELKRYKDDSRHHRRSVRQDHADERYTKKQKRESRKRATDSHSRYRHESKSRDGEGKNDTSDRWEPDTCPDRVRRSSRETRSSSVEEESKGVGESRHDETRKRKRI